MTTFQFGASTFPLPLSSRSLLEDADPPLFLALHFLSSALEQNIGQRLVAQARRAGEARIRRAVCTSLPYDPGPFLTEAQYEMPLFALFRKGDGFGDRTLHWREIRSEWGFAYVLPTLTAGKAEQLVPVLGAVARVLERAIDQGTDDAYAPPGGTRGDDVWERAGIAAAELRRAEYIVWTDGGGLVFPALVGEVNVTERAAPPPAGTLTPLESIGTTLAISDDDGVPLSVVESEARVSKARP